MGWVNPLDKVPQVPPDWGNHVIYGGVLGLVLQAGLSPLHALLGVFAVSALKKAVDYFKVGPPTESIAICVGKTLVTCAWPASFLLPELVRHLTR